MKVTVRMMLLAAALSLFPSCTSQRLADDAQAKLLMSASGRFFELKEAGRLPGIKSDDHGKLESFPQPYHERITYPFSVIVKATKEHDSSLYCYTFTKETSSSDWQLGEIWRLRPDNTREDLKSE